MTSTAPSDCDLSASLDFVQPVETCYESLSTSSDRTLQWRPRNVVPYSLTSTSRPKFHSNDTPSIDKNAHARIQRLIQNLETCARLVNHNLEIPGRDFLTVPSDQNPPQNVIQSLDRLVSEFGLVATIPFITWVVKNNAPFIRTLRNFISPISSETPNDHSHDGRTTESKLGKEHLKMLGELKTLVKELARHKSTNATSNSLPGVITDLQEHSQKLGRLLAVLEGWRENASRSQSFWGCVIFGTVEF